ncbi:hypothetical protein MHYP_G00241680 [Metynnis hypsauchen]
MGTQKLLVSPGQKDVAIDPARCELIPQHVQGHGRSYAQRAGTRRPERDQQVLFFRTLNTSCGSKDRWRKWTLVRWSSNQQLIEVVCLADCHSLQMVTADPPVADCRRERRTRSCRRRNTGSS